VEAVKLSHCVLYEGPTLDLEDAGEARRHKEEVELLLVVIESLSVAELTL
jgi:hypothetical protein